MFKKHLFCSIIFLLLAMSSLSGQNFTEKSEKIDNILKAYVDLDQFSGCVLVAAGGQPFYLKSVGEADKAFHVPTNLETKFNIGSIGKIFTAISIMQLAERGKLNVNDSVIQYLPEFPYGGKIKIFHLLTHTSGMYNYFAHADFRNKISTIRSVRDALDLIYDQKLLFDTPGEKYSYSNSGIVTLGAIIEKVSGQNYSDYIDEHILQPLGMENTGLYYVEEIIENRAEGYLKSASGKFTRNIFLAPPPNADGGIQTTVMDLLKLDRALYQNTLLTEESKRAMFTPFLENYGYCWRIERMYGHLKIYHGGGAPGISALFARYPEDDFTLIVLSNYDFAAGDVASVIEKIMFNQEYDYPREEIGPFLYRMFQVRGMDYVAENFDRLLIENNYELKRSVPLNLLGYDLLSLGKTDWAIVILRKNQEKFPDQANPYDSLGDAYLQKGDRESAAGNYRKALEIDPDFKSSREKLDMLQEK